jgi:hypothetical protein
MNKCPICLNEIRYCTCPISDHCCRCGQAAGSEARFTKLLEVVMKKTRTRGNYVADNEEKPTKVTFNDGRVVSIKNGYLDVSYKPKP